MNPVSNLQEEIKLDNKRHFGVRIVMPQVGKFWKQVFLNNTTVTMVVIKYENNSNSFTIE